MDIVHSVEFLKSLNPILQALIATGFTWFVTAVGAGTVFTTRSMPQKLLDGMLGFAAGVMIAASYWSLLAPALKMAEGGPLPVWMPAAIGFMTGGLFLRLIDRILPHLHLGLEMNHAEGLPTRWQKSILLVLAITLHNIPEGLAVGVAFGAAAAQFDGASFAGAVALAIGIGLQNFPEGIAVAMPLRREGLPVWKSFWYGQLSAVVEPIAGVIGAAIVVTSQAILPYALSFAAGAMIFVTVEEVIPESQQSGNADLATLCCMGGFTVMMILDVGLG